MKKINFNHILSMVIAGFVVQVAIHHYKEWQAKKQQLAG